MRNALCAHWPEYLMEAAGLGLFMLSACLFTTFIEHPASPVRQAIATPILRRMLMGLAMGLTAVGIVYSRWGQQSGAHLNPSVTLTFLRLGKVARWDAAFYVLSQLLGGAAGVAVAGLALGGLLADPAVNHAVTQPGAPGIAVAFVAEALISFVLMSVVLAVSNAARLARFTGLLAGVLVATYITLEAPLSGMSMNPARSLASALGAHAWRALWLYFVAPPLGMLLAAEVYRRVTGPRGVICAKLHHTHQRRCIFKCGYAMGALVLALLGASGGALAQTPAPAGPAARATAVTVVGVTVSDLERAVDFYSRVLGFEKEWEREVAGDGYERLQGLFGLRMRLARLRLGDERIELTEYLAPSTGRPIPADSRSHDHWFQHIAIVVSDMDAAYRRLREHRVRHASSGPQRLPDWNPNAGGIQAFYFKDPDGHVLEVIAFPPGKGDSRWQGRSGLFLGIDHTAIVVADTDRSLRFYRDTLGLAVAGGSENYGNEQEHLNNVFGARLRITTLRAAAGPGIELLEYLAPRDGRPFPSDARANDLVHWQTTVVIGDLTAAARRLRMGGGALLSPGPVSLPDGVLGFGAGLTVRDPDGHAIRLIP